MTPDHLDFLQGPAAQELLNVPLPADPLAALNELRKRCSPEQASAVMSLREVRRRAGESGKFPPPLAQRLLADDRMLQQSSSLRLAVYVGRRLARRLGEEPPSTDRPAVLDLCCGLGADAIGLLAAGLAVTGYDLDPQAVRCAAHNAAAAGMGAHGRFIQADVSEIDLPPSIMVHVDPDRRARGRRSIALADYVPGPAFLRTLPERTRAGVIKLSPALDWHVLADWAGVSAEYVSEAGTCRQLLAWWGPADAAKPARPAQRAALARCATVVWGEAWNPQSASLSAGLAPPAPHRPPGEFLIEPDSAVIAAGGVDDLAAAHGLWRIDGQLAWLFGPGPIDHPLARAYRVLRTVPGRLRDVQAALRELGAGLVEVKARGLKLDTDALQRSLRGRGERTLVAAWCRIGQRQQVFLCERLTRSA